MKKKECCKPENETFLYDEDYQQYYIICNKCFKFIRWEDK